ncbi:Sensor histidine kinase LnrJ [Anaerolineales bacterium]|nr:Sensor histidine kinase LnrJ [Anaerolineales bacterium]
MFNLTNNVSAILFITTLINSFNIYISWQRRKAKGGIYIVLAMLGVAFWTLSVGLDYAAIPISLKVFFEKLEYAFHNSTIALLALFSLTYADYGDWLRKKSVKAFFWIVPISNILLAWTNDWHGMLWSGFARSEFGNNTVIFERGPAYSWGLITGYLMVLIIILPLWRATHKGSDLSRRQARLLFAASILSVVGNTVYLLGDQQLKGVDWTPIIYSILGILFMLALYGTRLLDLVPIARYTIIEQMRDCILVLDENDRLADFNPAAREVFGISHEHFGKKIKMVMAHLPEVIESFSSNPGSTQQITVVHEGAPRVFDTHLTLFTDNLGKPYGKLMVFTDITKHHQAERSLAQRLSEIQELNKDLRESQSQVVSQQRRLAKIEERKRLGRDMHDSVSQTIQSLIFYSDALMTSLRKEQFQKAISVAERIQESGRRALKEIRLLLYETQSQEANEITDLVAVLKERFSFVENRVGIQTDIVLVGALDSIPKEWNENLFWMTNEALNNAIKHAFARKVWVRLCCSPQRLELEVSDNGKGFDITKARIGGMGLDNMHERASLLGGTLTIESQPEKGTTVRFGAEIPSR